MTYDFAFIDVASLDALWKQIYQAISEGIERGVLSPSEKLPSIRELSKTLNISRSPVENAYIHLQLNGLIESRPKKGYFVLKNIKREKTVAGKKESEIKKEIIYDLSGVGIDPNSVDISSWSRQLRSALKMQDKIFSEGDPQGEPELREALAKYCFKARKVKTSPERIIVSSGTQQLLTELCRMMERKGKVAIESPGYSQGERIFRDFGWDVVSIGDVEELPGIKLKEGKYDIFADITSNRPQMPLSSVVKRRKELLSWVSQKSSYILEDDYNGELRYFSRSFPSLQGFYPERVIYIGSFSRLLLPSVRIAYMVVPEDLAENTKIKSSLYDQTASKIEQLALAGYINEGHMERHIRRMKNIYQKKSKEMMEALKERFNERANYKLLETSLLISIIFKSNTNIELLKKAALTRGIEINNLFYDKKGNVVANLSFSSIPFDKIKAAVRELSDSWRDLIL